MRDRVRLPRPCAPSSGWSRCSRARPRGPRPARSSRRSPLMLVERTAYAADGTPVEFARDRYRGDRARCRRHRRRAGGCSRVPASGSPAARPPGARPRAGGGSGRCRSTAASRTATTACALGGRDVRRAAARQGHRAARDRPRRGARRHRRWRPRAGVGPEVGAFLGRRRMPRHPASSPAGRSTAAALREPGTLAEVAAALRAVHAGPPLATRLRRVPLVEAYREIAPRARRAVPRRLRAGPRPRRARSRRPWPAPSTRRSRATTTCSPRTSSSDDGTHLRIVDWEYAGMGDRYFDLANLSINNGSRGRGRRAPARGLLRGALHRRAASPRCASCG